MKKQTEQQSVNIVLDTLISRQESKQVPVVGIDAEINALLSHFNAKYDLSDYQARYQEVLKIPGYNDKLQGKNYKLQIEYCIQGLNRSE